MRCVLDPISLSPPPSLKLPLRELCEEFVIKLGGATLCGLYGGGGCSAKLPLSVKGSPDLRVLEVTDTMSEVSMPVR
jgi:hypothetical protein